MMHSNSLDISTFPFFSRQGHSEGDHLLDLHDVINRFRANLVIAGVEPFEEDNWSHLIIGNTQFVVSWRAEIQNVYVISV